MTLNPSNPRAKQRWGLLAVIAFILSLVGAAAALAVHDINAFELEGNATNAPLVAGDDWDQVCHEVTITNDTGNTIPNQCANAGDTAAFGGANAVSWKEELDKTASIFTGGGSKDIYDVDQWAGKNAGGLPDKDNLLHAFAARYTVPQVGTGTTCPTTLPGDTCDILYFGSDRFDNSGDAVQGFWFLQNECTDVGGPKIGGGSGFVCTEPGTPSDPSDDFHKVGDLLVVTEFSNGGATSNIAVYKWDPANADTSGTLDFLAAFSNKCSGTLSADGACGVVNPAETPLTEAPWTFLDKSGNSDYLNGELFEAGVNLSSPSINLSGQCFATLVADSRASTSPTSVLKDYVIGGFGRCTSSVNSTQSWTPKDEATVSASQPFTGTVTFSLWDAADCGEDGTSTALYTSSAIPVSTADPTASTDDSTSTPAKPSAVSASGTFYWKVFFDAVAPIPDATSCVEQTDLTIDNDNTPAPTP